MAGQTIPQGLQGLSVGEVLEQWGLASYRESFAEEGVDGLPELLSLTDDELKTDLRLKLGDRKRFHLAKSAAVSSSSSLTLLSSTSPLPPASFIPFDQLHSPDLRTSACPSPASSSPD